MLIKNDNRSLSAAYTWLMNYTSLLTACHGKHNNYELIMNQQ